ncbi:MAG: manganese efflux pump MntP family protein [Lachnospiraceae bacterium]|jgi:putative Mn2+ efflux pump MntP|nr:manganese efflux pump MntP family protein [Lachnospiraceae bacterium]
MSIGELFLVAVSLSMDAFAVSVCKGLAAKAPTARQTLVVGLYFGAFQALMPLLGYFVGSRFEAFVAAFSHWIAFALLALIGVNMIRESREADTCSVTSASFGPRDMLPLALATSIDAFAVGVSFAFLEINIWLSVIFIGIITLCLSVVGVRSGKAFGGHLKSRAELVGGLILIGIGVKIVVEGLFF